MYSSNSDSALTGFLAGRADNNGYNNGGMWGMDGWFGLIIILALLGGWGFGGFGGGFGGGANGVAGTAQFTDAAVQRGFDTQTIIGKLDGINSGLCDGFYAMNTSLLQGFNGVDNAICSAQYATQQGFNATQVAMMQGFNAAQAQAADCCCKTQTNIMQLGNQMERGFCDVNYNMATNTNALAVQMANNTRDIIDSQKSGTQAILSYLCDRQIADLQQENQALRLTASQQAQNATIGAMITASEANILRRTGSDCPIPAYVVPNPNCCYGPYGNYGYNGFGYGYNNNSGCNSGCCGCNG